MFNLKIIMDLEISEQYMKVCQIKHTSDQALNYDSLFIKPKAFGDKCLRMRNSEVNFYYGISKFMPRVEVRASMSYSFSRVIFLTLTSPF